MVTSSVESRLRSWEKVLEQGGPRWLVECAPRIVEELRAELKRKSQ